MTRRACTPRLWFRPVTRSRRRFAYHTDSPESRGQRRQLCDIRFSNGSFVYLSASRFHALASPFPAVTKRLAMNLAPVNSHARGHARAAGTNPCQQTPHALQPLPSSRRPPQCPSSSAKSSTTQSGTSARTKPTPNPSVTEATWWPEGESHSNL